MGEIANINKKTDLIEQATEFLLDTRESIDRRLSVILPIVKLESLGTGIASMLPVFRTEKSMVWFQKRILIT